MRLTLLVALVAPAAFPLACKPKAPPAPPAPATTSVRADVTLEELTGALHLWLMKHPKLPTDVRELVSAKLVPGLPPLPPGKKFAIDAQQLKVVMVSE